MEATQPHSLFSLLHPHNSSLERRELKRRAPASPSHRTVVKSGLAERLYGLHLVKQPLNFNIKCFKFQYSLHRAYLFLELLAKSNLVEQKI